MILFSEIAHNSVLLTSLISLSFFTLLFIMCKSTWMLLSLFVLVKMTRIVNVAIIVNVFIHSAFLQCQEKSTHSPAWVILHSGAPAERRFALSSLAHPPDAACAQSLKPVAASSPAQQLQCLTCVAVNRSTTQQNFLIIRFFDWYLFKGFLQHRCCWPGAAESPDGACRCFACAARPFVCRFPSVTVGHRSAAPGQLSSASEPLCLHAGFAAASGLLPTSQDAGRGIQKNQANYILMI